MRRHLDITAGVLVGGHGRRMGAIDKARLPHAAGGTFIEHIVQSVAPRVAEVVLLGRAEQSYPEVACRLLVDPLPNAGPLAGLAALLAAATTRWCLLLACDLAAFDGALIDLLAAARAEESIVVPRTGEERHWTAALYRRELPAAAALASGARALHRFAASVGYRELSVGGPLAASLANPNELPGRSR